MNCPDKCHALYGAHLADDAEQGTLLGEGKVSEALTRKVLAACDLQRL